MLSITTVLTFAVFCHLAVSVEGRYFTLYNGTNQEGTSEEFHVHDYDCHNLPSNVWNAARSIHTHGHCVMLYPTKDCQGQRFIIGNNCKGSECCRIVNDFTRCKLRETDENGKFVKFVTLNAAQSFTMCPHFVV